MCQIVDLVKELEVVRARIHWSTGAPLSVRCHRPVLREVTLVATMAVEAALSLEIAVGAAAPHGMEVEIYVDRICTSRYLLTLGQE